MPNKVAKVADKASTSRVKAKTVAKFLKRPATKASKAAAKTRRVVDDPKAQALQNVADGAAALRRTKKVWLEPGVKLKLAASIQRYHADPEDPTRLVRVLNGKTRTGKLVDGVFKPAS